MIIYNMPFLYHAVAANRCNATESKIKVLKYKSNKDRARNKIEETLFNDKHNRIGTCLERHLNIERFSQRVIGLVAEYFFTSNKK